MLLLTDISVRRVSPHFSNPPEDAEVVPGGSVNLTCVAVGSPMPRVRWQKNSVEMIPEDQFDQTPIGRSDLVLTNITESATFTCVAYSSLGTDEASADVRVKGGDLLSRDF